MVRQSFGLGNGVSILFGHVLFPPDLVCLALEFGLCLSLSLLLLGHKGGSVGRLSLSFRVCFLLGRMGSNRLLVDLLLASGFNLLSPADLSRFGVTNLPFLCFFICTSFGRSNGRGLFSGYQVLEPRKFSGACTVEGCQRCFFCHDPSGLKGSGHDGRSLETICFGGYFGADLVLVEGHEDTGGVVGLGSFLFGLDNFSIITFLLSLIFLASQLVLLAVVRSFLVGLLSFLGRLAVSRLASGQLLI